MINANELRVGNWVYLPTSGENFEQQVRHVGLESVNGFDLEECDPIPLTEEVLLKCGYVRDSFEHYHRNTKPNMPLYRRGVYIGCLGQGLSSKDFEYLHELQNRYFSITGHELTYAP